MQFKHLNLVGFKSFVENTKLEFGTGITAIVGPNGSGKSNISDAIRWVLGEQKTRSLRGNTMEDLIFNGSASRKSLGMAEVSLTLTNLQGKLSHPFKDYDELEITRRVYRSGESEFSINNVPCRLKDIVDIFLDSGLSLNAFSLVEQGRINQILNSKPIDKRFIIEEAAGIIKYKNRRNEALRKMESTEANLIRVNDILGEIKRNRNSLKRQATRAKTYKNIKNEIRDIELTLLASHYKSLEEDMRKAKEEEDALATAEMGISTALAKKENETETVRFQINELANHVTEIRREKYEMVNSIEKSENRTEILRNNIENRENEIEHLTAEIEELKNESGMMKEHIEKLKKEENKLSLEISTRSALCEEKINELNALSHRLDEDQKKVDEKKARLIDLLSTLSREKNDIVGIDARIDDLRRRKERLSHDERTTRAHADECKRAILACKDADRTFSATLGEIQECHEKREKELEQSKRIENELQETMMKGKEKLASKTSRYDSLQEIKENFEGFYESVRSIMMRKKEHSEFQGIKGIVTDVIESDAKFESAIAAALGERLQGLFYEKTEEAVNAIQFLKSHRGGRCTFIPVPSPKGNGKDAPRRSDMPSSILGRASDFLVCGEEYQKSVMPALENIFVVDTLHTALMLRENDNFSWPLVTLDGEILYPDGTITGGSPDRSGTMLLKNKREMKGLGVEIKKLKTLLKELSVKYDDALSQRREIEEEIDGLRKRVNHTEMDLHNNGKELERLDEELSKLKKIIESYRFEKDEVESEMESLRKEKEAKTGMISSLHREQEEKEKDISLLKSEVEARKSVIESLRQHVTELRIEITSHEGALNSVRGDIKSYSERIGDVAQRIESKNARIQTLKDEKRDLAAEIEELKTLLIELSEKSEEKKREITEKEETLYGLKDKLSGIELEIKSVRKEMDEHREKIKDTQLKKTEITVKIDALKEKAVLEYRTHIDAVIETYFSPSIDEDEKNKRVRMLKNKLERFGDVNLTAIEEFQALEERFTFLDKQRQDLVDSLESLKKVIQRINRTTRRRFLKAFEEVNENFKKCFTRLFEGGGAELILSDPDNLLETGVDIIAQPPGKKLRNLNLLSAGEKALTSVALLLAVFQVKPSPFCLLDEIDAPLDDANVIRVNEMLKEMTNDTQFILVTHNKHTMSYANTLYGVSMEEDGISKMISVDLNTEDMLSSAVV